MSGFGTARQIAAAQYFSRFWSEADIQRAALTESPIDPVFRPDSVVLAISVEKDGNLRVVYGRIGRCRGRPAWRDAQAAVAALPRRYVSRWGERRAGPPSPLCVTDPP
jgi:hypothetical protein